MALIQISDLDATASFLTELQDTDTTQIIGGNKEGNKYGYGEKEEEEHEGGKKGNGNNYYGGSYYGGNNGHGNYYGGSYYGGGKSAW